MIKKSENTRSALFSIIIPVYNVKAYLPDCIESVLAQSVHWWEMILVDDGSTDESGDICEQYAHAYANQRICVIHQNNQGLSAARNTGIRHAKGEYLLFLDSDDMIAPDSLRILWEVLKKETKKPDLIMFNHAKIDPNGGILEYSDRIKDCKFHGYQEVRNWAFSTTATYTLPWNKLYHQHLFQKVTFAEGKIHEDEYIYHKIMLQCKHVICIEDNLYLYRIRPESIMTRKWTIKRLDAVEGILSRAESLSGYRELSGPAMKCLYKASRILNDYYLESGMIKDKLHKKRNKELQKQFRRTVRKLFFKVGLKEKIYFIITYVDLYKGIHLWDLFLTVH